MTCPETHIRRGDVEVCYVCNEPLATDLMQVRVNREVGDVIVSVHSGCASQLSVNQTSHRQ